MVIFLRVDRNCLGASPVELREHIPDQGLSNSVPLVFWPYGKPGQMPPHWRGSADLISNQAAFFFDHRGYRCLAKSNFQAVTRILPDGAECSRVNCFDSFQVIQIHRANIENFDLIVVKVILGMPGQHDHPVYFIKSV